MATYIALLRGINVSGQKRIKMDTLRSIFESLQFQNVRTYIQSGNVIFEAPEEDSTVLRERIENELHDVLGYDVTVILRTVGELEEVIRRNPFDETEHLDSKRVENAKLYITFLLNEPSDEAIHTFQSYQNDVDDVRVLNREVYILCRQGYGRSLFSNTLVEKKLGVLATTRNWDTVNAIARIARG
jgi:uncharacterized protein (DUF1697 family)